MKQNNSKNLSTTWTQAKTMTRLKFTLENVNFDCEILAFGKINNFKEIIY